MGQLRYSAGLLDAICPDRLLHNLHSAVGALAETAGLIAIGAWADEEPGGPRAGQNAPPQRDTGCHRHGERPLHARYPTNDPPCVASYSATFLAGEEERKRQGDGQVPPDTWVSPKDPRGKHGTSEPDETDEPGEDER
jgi:hypothetical protein